MRALLVTATLAVFIGSALAHDGGKWANSPPDIRAWFSKVMQPYPNNNTSCCGEGDAYKVKLDGNEQDWIRAIITEGDSAYGPGTLFLVPKDKLQIKYGNPLDEIILFIDSAGHPLCLIPKVGA